MAIGTMASISGQSTLMTDPTPREMATTPTPSYTPMALVHIVFNTKTVPLEWTVSDPWKTQRILHLTPEILC